MQWSLGFLNEASEISAARKSAVFGTPRPNKWLAEADSPDLPFIGFTFYRFYRFDCDDGCDNNDQLNRAFVLALVVEKLDISPNLLYVKFTL